MPIHVLSDQLASQIAAGEVVERPASVVKELVENALDAGATVVNVDVRAGGRQLVQVADNGAGIPAAEVELAFQRHATSKLRTVDDLSAIATLGFRGEALAAIAAMSQVTLVTRAAGEPAGIRLVLEGGRQVGRDAVGAPLGSVVAVENLFYNVPARLKFLKTITVDRRHIDELITRYALAYPAVRFRLAHDGRVTFQSPGNGSALDVLVAVYGPEVARQLLPLEEGRLELPLDREGESGPAAGELTVAGYVGPPGLHWATRSHVVLYVNGRWIKDNSLTYAVIQAYHTLLPTGRYPLAIVSLSLPYDQVDVNVHPAKTEIRFRQPGFIFSAVQRAVRQTLVAASPVPNLALWLARPDGPTGAWSGSLDHDGYGQGALELEAGTAGDDWPAATGPDRVETPFLAGERLPIMRVVGQVGAAYIITEGPDGIFLIDQHAAHERILYERFMTEWSQNQERQSVTAQGLVTGAAVHLAPAQATLVADNLELLGRLGFTVEPFGPNAFMVRSVPALVANLDPTQALLAVVEDLERDAAPLHGRLEARLIRRVCKTAAVKAGQTLSTPEMEALIRQLELCDSPLTCPHGRPTLIHLSATQLARQFGRT